MYFQKFMIMFSEIIVLDMSINSVQMDNNQVIITYL